MSVTLDDTRVVGLMSESLVSTVASRRVITRPDGNVMVIVYEPGTRLANEYAPALAPVAVVVEAVTAIPAPVVPFSATVTPPMPGSPLSCEPLPLRSSHTKSPRAANL